MKRNRPTVITDAPEHRAIPIERVELRAADDNADEVELTGYASTFEPYEMYGGPERGGWIEQIDRKAFAKTLRESPDLMLLINHEGMPLARTKSGTLKLSVDSHGLKVSAKLDRSDPDVQRLEAKMRRGDMDEMSFAFRVKAQKWEATDDFPEDLYALRTILEVSLHKGDVSVVNYGANPTTHAEVKGLDVAIQMLADADHDALERVEARSDSDVIARAKAALESLLPKPPFRVEVSGTDQSRVRAAADKVAAALEELTDAKRGQPDLTAPANDPFPPQSKSGLIGPDGARMDATPGADPDDKARGEKTKGMSYLEAMRRQGFGPEDGSLLKRADTETMVAESDAAIEELRAKNAGHAALLAKLTGSTGPDAE
ncbi:MULTISPECIES: HK97 family phage prohead protease [Mycolicibacterium]|uniref:HK97 family phage prohead protease n=1 Tax=Mycolicibacterium TaxID=1866885 RepID=UPI001CDD4A1D|nr:MULTISPECIES: HK97 family phage prohead protease [Mycolicibacterium]MCC9181085.1 HK97 family phage prohead protease [Mycolicibacterium mageritense]UBV14803.1 HK97 family phage prohead protease [Mycolicibacterium fortuitum]